MSLVLASARTARAADPPCGAVDIRFKPGAPNMQIVVWIEDANGKFVDTAYITRLTGQFGLGNRPGTPLLKTDFRWPYGRREMVAPIWANRRNHKYPKVMMGGVCGWSPQTLCPNGGGACGGDCVDSTIAYHSRVSSYEPFYCSPRGASMIDAMSCASKGTFSKGAYAPFPQSFSLYPPRADLTMKNYDPNFDGADLLDFAKRNDLAAVSQATPPSGMVLDPPLTWFPQNLPQGDYVAWIELSQESDFNASHNHPNQPDTEQTWDVEGHPFLGQPSIVYKVPFKYTVNGGSAIATSYSGYSTWDGSDGTLHPPDGTITTNQPGTGAGRLLDVNDGMDVYRVKVVVGSCQGMPQPDGGVAMDDGGAGAGDGGTSMGDGGAATGNPDGGGVIMTRCDPPAPVQDLSLTASATSITVDFKAPATGVMPNRYAIRYREGTDPLADDEFNSALAAPSVAADMPLHVTITGLIAKTSYAVAVRSVASCGAPSKVASAVIATDEQQFTKLSGCFVATAAYGSALEPAVRTLRAFRDGTLLADHNPSGALFVCAYYAFGPSLAGAIAGRPALRALVRAALRPLVEGVTRLQRLTGAPTMSSGRTH